MSQYGKPTPGVPAFPVNPDTSRPPYSQADAAAALDPSSGADAETLALLELRAILARAREALAKLEDSQAEAAAWVARRVDRP